MNGMTVREFDRGVDASISRLHMEPDIFLDRPELATCPDPVLWLREVVGVQPWDMQARIARSVANHSRTSVASCHGAGKSFVGASIVTWATQVHDDAIVISTAPTDRQVREILWREIHKMAGKSRTSLKGNLLTQKWTISPEVFAFGFTAPDNASDKFQGFHAAKIFIIVDEASGISQEIFDAIDGISTGEVHVLEIGNPLNASGAFFESFSDPLVKKFTISAFDTPNLTRFGIGLREIKNGDWKKLVDPKLEIPGMATAAWVADMLSKHGEDSVFWLARVLGLFPEQGEDTMFTLSLILEAQRLIMPPKEDDEVELGVDVARFGSDETCIWRRRGKQYRRVEKFGKKDTMHTVGRVVRIFKETKGCKLVRVDDTGVGGGVTDRLKELKIPTVGIVASGKAVNEDDYANRRGEMAGAVREVLINGEADIPDDPILSEQLANVRIKKFTSKGQLLLESKDEMKKRMKGKSPDDYDAFALLFAPFRQVPSMKHAGAVNTKNVKRKSLDLGGM